MPTKSYNFKNKTSDSHPEHDKKDGDIIIKLSGTARTEMTVNLRTLREELTLSKEIQWFSWMSVCSSFFDVGSDAWLGYQFIKGNNYTKEVYDQNDEFVMGYDCELKKTIKGEVEK